MKPKSAQFSISVDVLRLLVLLLLLMATASAAEFYVGPKGSDRNAGSRAMPFVTIQHAADVVQPGDTVVVLDGVYRDPSKRGTGSKLVRVSRGGVPSKYVTFRAEHKWGAVLDGGNATEEGWSFVASFVRVEGFEIRNFTGEGLSNWPGGQHIEIDGNNIHDIGRYCTDTGNGRNGIFISHDNVIVDRNIIHNIGRYGEGENGCKPLKTYYQNNDHGIYISGGASNIVIRNNVFHDISHGWSIQVYPKPVDRLSILNNTFAFPNPWRPGHIVIAAKITHSQIINNIFYQPTRAAIYFKPTVSGLLSHDVLVANNISSNRMAEVFNYSWSPETSGSLVTGAIFARNQENTDPKLSNPKEFQFIPATAGPADRSGLSRPEISHDFEGKLRSNPPAIGAYEPIRN